MKISEVITKETIKLNLKSVEKEEVFGEMIQLLVHAGKVSNRQVALNRIEEREAQMSTGIGNGLALPHAQVPELDEICIALGISQEGIEYDSFDDQPVYVLFMILSREGEAAPHLEALAEISRLCSNQDFLERLRNAKTVEEVLKCIDAEE